MFALGFAILKAFVARCRNGNIRRGFKQAQQNPLLNKNSNFTEDGSQEDSGQSQNETIDYYFHALMDIPHLN